MTANVAVTLFTVALALAAGYLSAQQRTLAFALVVGVPLLAAVVLAAKRLVPAATTGGWVASFLFVWALAWTVIHNL
jgi:hypothetical protein